MEGEEPNETKKTVKKKTFEDFEFGEELGQGSYSIVNFIFSTYFHFLFFFKM